MTIDFFTLPLDDNLVGSCRIHTKLRQISEVVKVGVE
jgi:hypothetical protein